MVIRIVICFIFSFLILFLHAQEKVEVIINDTLLQSGKDVLRREGQANWEDDLRKKINPLVLIENKAPDGRYRVQVQYIFFEDGILSDTKPLTSLGYGMEQEVIRMLRKKSSWIPAEQEAKPKKAYGKLTVTFIKKTEGYAVTTSTPYTLYAGVDNPVTVSTPALKPRQLKVTVSKNATIKSTGKFTYIVKVNTPGERVIFTLKNRKRHKIVKYSIDTEPSPAPAK